MIAPADCICVACSGGADSVCLLMILNALCQEGKLACSLMACHLNHMLRGRESDEDEAYVRELCERLDIPLVAVREDVQNAGAAGLEAAGRAARERLYALCIQKYGATKIALAHHMDDQAETVLFHMARGAALSGLEGIHPVRGNKIRPLLGVRRSEIESWLRAQNITWRTDKSNASDAYTRNRIRHHILPAIESEVNAGAVRHIADAAETIRLADQWMQEVLRPRYAEQVTDTDDGRILIKNGLAEEAEFVQRTLIMQALAECAGMQRDISVQHVRQVQELLAGQAGRRQDLPHRIRAYRTYDGVYLSRTDETEAGGKYRQACKNGQTSGTVRKAGEDFSGICSVIAAGYSFSGEYPAQIPEPIPEKTYTKWLNCDKITGSIVIRTRRPGDYIMLERGGRQSIKSWMINQKIPGAVRDRIPLVVHETEAGQPHGAEVLWIVGGRISASARVNSGTKHVLMLTAEKLPETDEF